MSVDLIYTVSDNNYINLKTDSIMSIDSYTKEFDDMESLCSNSQFADKIGIFIYDNFQEIEDDNLTARILIKYTLEKDDLSNLKFFIGDIFSQKIIYLPVVFSLDFQSESEMEKFIKENSLLYGKIFLNKIKTSSKRYLYLRIYYNYIQKRIDRKMPFKKI